MKKRKESGLHQTRWYSLSYLLPSTPIATQQLHLDVSQIPEIQHIQNKTPVQACSSFCSWHPALSLSLFLQAYLFWPHTFSSKHQPYVMTFMFAMLSFTFESFTCSFCLILCFNSSSNFSLVFICKFRWHLLQKDFPESLKCQLAGPNLCADRPLNFSPIGLWLP